MAIGTAAAIGIGLAGVGSAVSASSNRSAANTAANVSQENNAANVALQRDIYGQNRQILSPFVERGNVAGNAMNALLGLGGTQNNAATMQMPTQSPSGVQPSAPATMQAPNALSQFGGGMNSAFNSGFNPAILGNNMIAENRGGPEYATIPQAIPGNAGLPYGLGDNFITTGTVNNGLATSNPQTGLQTPGTQNGQTAQQAAENAFDIFRNSTGYQFRVNEGTDALNSGFAGSGMLQSGAALRSLDDYRQGMASAEFNNYMGLLGQQQNVGIGGASALAGVGQNFANNVGFMNTQNANNQANAAIARGQNNVFGNMAGMIGGGLFGYGSR